MQARRKSDKLKELEKALRIVSAKIDRANVSINELKRERNELESEIKQQKLDDIDMDSEYSKVVDMFEMLQEYMAGVSCKEIAERRGLSRSVTWSCIQRLHGMLARRKKCMADSQKCESDP